MHTQYWQFSIATGNATRVNVTKFTKLMKELSGSFPFEVDIRGKNEVYYLGLGI
ncbi:hypothetical protein [Rhizobium brockwellii]